MTTRQEALEAVAEIAYAEELRIAAERRSAQGVDAGPHGVAVDDHGALEVRAKHGTE